MEKKMKKKKNEYKPQRHKYLFKNIISILGTALLAYIFIIVGYSVAKPFGEIGEIKSKDIDLISNDFSGEQLEAVPTESSENAVKAYWLKEEEFESSENLNALIGQISTEYDMVIVPLKIKGGMLNYNSSNEGAVLAEAGNEIELSDIFNTVRSAGFTPVASINSMNDNIYPTANKNSGFIVNSSKKLWYDTNDGNGKPWLNPSSADTKQYLSSITGEIAQAGFKYIICTDMEYPAFSENALEEIGGIAEQKDRYLDLIDNVNIMAKSAENKDSELWLEIPAYDMLKETCEVFFKPIMLNSKKYILKINLNLFNDKINCNGKNIDFSKMTYTEKIETICEETEKNIYKTSFIPEVISSDLNPQQKTEIEKLFEKLDYKSFIIR